MYVNELLTIMVKATENTFHSVGFPNDDFRGINITTEYPSQAQSYPMIWIEYTPSGALVASGVNHILDNDDGAGGLTTITGWRYGGRVDFTTVVLGEHGGVTRNRLFDEVVRMIAFGSNYGYSGFRNYIEGSNLLVVQANYDELEQGRFAATGTTPWGTNEPVYEATLTLTVSGEFFSDNDTQDLVELTQIDLITAKGDPALEPDVAEPDPPQFDEAGWF